jgi:hypothetical protein
MDHKTVFVVGAGASKEFGLPTGDELKNKIADILEIRPQSKIGDEMVVNALNYAVQANKELKLDINELYRKALRIGNAMPLEESIDNFIDSHRGDFEVELCSKIAVVRAILEAELDSKLSGLNFSSIEDTWPVQFFKLLKEKCSKEDIAARLTSVSFVIFNYDRCFEYFLFHALQAYYDGLSQDAAATLVRNLKIYHPYGTVGSLPFYHKDNSTNFGVVPSAQQLYNLSKSIKTFTEGTDPNSSDIVAIRNNIKQSTRLVFLGFAFHPLNLDLLFLDGSTSEADKSREIFATGYGISESDSKLIANEIGRRTNTNFGKISIRNDLQCYKLFGEYWRSLSLL